MPKWEKLVIILVMISFVFFGYKYLLYTEKKEWGSTSRLYTDVYDLKSLVGKMGIMNFFLEDTFKYVLRSNLISVSDVKFLQSWQKSRMAPALELWVGSVWVLLVKSVLMPRSSKTAL